MTPRAPATYDEVVGLVGELDPITIGRILATGATIDEIAEAQQEVADELGFGDEPHPPSTPRVAEVRAVLDELADDDALAADEDRPAG